MDIMYVEKGKNAWNECKNLLKIILEKGVNNEQVNHKFWILFIINIDALFELYFDNIVLCVPQYLTNHTWKSLNWASNMWHANFWQNLCIGLKWIAQSARFRSLEGKILEVVMGVHNLSSSTYWMASMLDKSPLRLTIISAG